MWSVIPVPSARSLSNQWQHLQCLSSHLFCSTTSCARLPLHSPPSPHHSTTGRETEKDKCVKYGLNQESFLIRVHTSRLFFSSPTRDAASPASKNHSAPGSKCHHNNNHYHHRHLASKTRFSSFPWCCVGNVCNEME